MRPAARFARRCGLNLRIPGRDWEATRPSRPGGRLFRLAHDRTTEEDMPSLVNRIKAFARSLQGRKPFTDQAQRGDP